MAGLVDHTGMDRIARWFTREIAIKIAQRLLVEMVVVFAVLLAALISFGVSPPLTAAAVVVALPLFAVLRVVSSCFLNPLNSIYLTRWPHPTGDIHPVEQTNADSETDLALKSHGFVARGAIDEWGGATTNIYTRGANQTIVLTSDDADLIVLSGLTDTRLVATTKQLIPPHRRLVLNHRYDTDVTALLLNHVEVLKTLTDDGHRIVPMTLDHVIELLVIEWASWDQIGPVVGPFIGIGQKRSLGLLQARVDPAELLERSLAKRPRITADRADGDRWTIPTSQAEPASSFPTVSTAATSDTTTAPTTSPTSALASLALAPLPPAPVFPPLSPTSDLPSLAPARPLRVTPQAAMATMPPNATPPPHAPTPHAPPTPQPNAAPPFAPPEGAR